MQILFRRIRLKSFAHFELRLDGSSAVIAG